MRVGSQPTSGWPAEAQGIRCVRQGCISVLARADSSAQRNVADRGQAARPSRPVRRGRRRSARQGHSCLQPHPRLDQAGVLKARAEVERFAGASGHAAASLRAALQIYEDRRATTLAEQVRAALASLTTQPDLESA